MTPGGPARILLAILAGATAGPLFMGVELVIQLLVEGRLQDGSSLVKTLAGIAGLLAVSTVVGAPIALAAILIIFGPMWMMHHRRGLGRNSFVFLATLAGCVMGAFITAVTGRIEPIMILLFALATAPTGAIMWWVGYGNSPEGSRVAANVSD